MTNLLVFLVIALLPNPINSESDSLGFDDPRFGHTRLCFTCLNPVVDNKTIFPKFSTRNLPFKKGTKFTSCYFHAKDRCGGIGAEDDESYKCYIKMAYQEKENKYIMTKGCVKDLSIKDGCTPATNDDSTFPPATADQICYCSRRLCNSDLVLIGGSAAINDRHFEQPFVNSGGTVMVKWWVVVVALTLLGVIRFSDTLTCCTGTTPLIIRVSTDEDQKLGEPCTNRGTSCTNVRCGENTCAEDYFEPDTECQNLTLCNKGTNPACRLLYVEVTDDKSDPKEPDEPPNLDTTYYVRQDCFDNSLSQADMTCDFYRKDFYGFVYDDNDPKIIQATKRTRYLKECFCNNSDYCNADLFRICAAADKRVKTENDTCQAGVEHTSAGLGTTSLLIINFAVLLSTYF